MATQKHVRFNPDIADCETDERQCQWSLVMLSVTDQTRYQYQSRLNTMCRYLRKRRGLASEVEVDPVSCTRAEFLGFLKSWKDQTMGDPECTRCALLLWQRASGIESPFTEETAIRRAVVGAAGEPGPDKLVLDNEQQGQYEEFLMNCETECWGGCRGCKLKLDIVTDRALMVHASRFLKQVPCRLHNLKEFRYRDMHPDTGEVYVQHMKTCKGGPGYAPYDLVAQEIVASIEECAAGRFNSFLFPTCVQKHLTQSLRAAGSYYGWDAGLVHTGYCLRHSGMRNRKSKAAVLVDAILAADSGCTAQNAHHYARDNAKRRKKGGTATAKKRKQGGA